MALFLALFVVTSVTLAVQGSAALHDFADGRLAHIHERGWLIVGVKTDYPPWGMVDEDGNIVGLEPDLARDLATRLGLPLELVPVTTANRMQRLQQGEVDVVVATVGDTAVRRETVDLIRPHYYASGVRLLASKDRPFTSWDELRGRTVCLTDGAYFNKAMVQRYLVKPLVFSGTRDNLLALKDGRCVGWAYDDAALLQVLQEHGLDEYALALPPVLETQWSVAVRKGQGAQTLGRFVRASIIDWHRSGYLQALRHKWQLPASDFLQRAHDKWSAPFDADCRPQANGFFPEGCLGLTRDSAGGSTAHVPDWVVGLKSRTGIDFTALFDPFNRDRLLTGVRLTVAISLVSIVGSLLLGIALALVQHCCHFGIRRWIVSLPCRGLLAVARMTPPVLQLYVVYFGVSQLLGQYVGISLGSFVVGSLIFSLYAGASNAALLVPALARQQSRDPDAGLAARVVRAIEQNFEALTSILVNIVKAASLASIIALPDVISAVTTVIGQGGDATSLMTLLVVFYLGFILLVMACFGLLRKLVVR